MTDVATGWTECMALLFKDKEAVLLALGQARGQMPFPLLGLDTDNGSEFLNYALLEYCRREEITFTRSRPYKKNDQCHVEQKNGSVVRKMIGYDRFEGLLPCRILGELYQVLRLYVNFFQPSVKLISKQRQGSKVIKKYDPAKTPYQRVMASETVSEAAKQALQEQYKGLDPVVLLRRIEQLQNQLWQYAHLDKAETIPPASPASAGGEPLSTEPRAEKPTLINGDGACVSADDVQVDLALRESTRRYRRTKKPRKKVHRWWRTHKDAFAEVWHEAEAHLRQTPYMQAKALFQALQRKYPGQFKDGQLRTFQRRVKAWRLKQVTPLAEKRPDNDAARPRLPIPRATPDRATPLGAREPGSNEPVSGYARSGPTLRV